MKAVQPASSKIWINTNGNNTSGKNKVKKRGHFRASASSGARPRKTLPTRTVATKNPRSAIRYQCTPTRHLRHLLNRSRTPSFPLVAAVTRKAGSATPRMVAIETTALKASPSERSTGRASSPLP
jgi:hypothetical protein